MEFVLIFWLAEPIVMRTLTFAGGIRPSAGLVW
jgi:hypothetical protein